MSSDLDEARAIIAQLEQIRDRLTVQDRRFVESWGLFLARADSGPVRIGTFRLMNLRRTAEGYGLGVPAEAPAMCANEWEVS
jgi:hypothetical protein